MADEDTAVEDSLEFEDSGDLADLDLMPDDDDTQSAETAAEPTDNQAQDPDADDAGATDEDAAKATDDDASQEAAAKPEGKPGTPNVALQHVQQKQAALDKKLDGITETLASLTQAIKASPGGKPTEKQAEEVAEVADDVAGLLANIEQIDNDDLIEGQAIKGVLKNLAQLMSKAPKDGATDIEKLVEEKLAAREKAAKEQRSQEEQQVVEFEAGFYKKYPALEEDRLCGEVCKRAEKAVKDEYGDLSQSAQDELFRTKVFPRIAAEAEAEVKAAKGKTPKQQSPASKQPPNNSQGATTKPNGASAGRFVAAESGYLDEGEDDRIPDDLDSPD